MAIVERHEPRKNRQQVMCRKEYRSFIQPLRRTDVDDNFLCTLAGETEPNRVLRAIESHFNFTASSPPLASGKAAQGLRPEHLDQFLCQVTLQRSLGRFFSVVLPCSTSTCRGYRIRQLEQVGLASPVLANKDIQPFGEFQLFRSERSEAVDYQRLQHMGPSRVRLMAQYVKRLVQRGLSAASGAPTLLGTRVVARRLRIRTGHLLLDTRHQVSDGTRSPSVGYNPAPAG